MPSLSRAHAVLRVGLGQVENKPLEAVKAMSLGTRDSTSVVRVARNGLETDVLLRRAMPAVLGVGRSQPPASQSRTGVVHADASLGPHLTGFPMA